MQIWLSVVVLSLLIMAFLIWIAPELDWHD